MFRKLIFNIFPQNSPLKRNIHAYNLKDVRRYCQVTKTCWNCQSSTASVEVFCSKCQIIQLTPKIDYFDLFGIQKEPKINMKELTRRFRNIQNEIHPDRFSNKSTKEQELSSDWSSLVNKAYKILQTPLSRGEYLLRLMGITLPEENTIKDPEFLMEMMERNEEVEEAESKDDLLSLLTKLQDDISELTASFASAYQSKNYAAATNYLVKMKYLASIENKTKEKILQY